MYQVHHLLRTLKDILTLLKIFLSFVFNAALCRYFKLLTGPKIFFRVLASKRKAKNKSYNSP
jgi:hypothetical protein